MNRGLENRQKSCTSRKRLVGWHLQAAVRPSYFAAAWFMTAESRRVAAASECSAACIAAGGVWSSVRAAGATATNWRMCRGRRTQSRHSVQCRTFCNSAIHQQVRGARARPAVRIDVKTFFQRFLTFFFNFHLNVFYVYGCKHAVVTAHCPSGRHKPPLADRTLVLA